MAIERFSDFAVDERRLSGTKLDMKDVLNKEIVIQGWRVIKSHIPNKECLEIQFTFNGEESGEVHVAFTNSEVLLRQCRKYERQQFIATIKNENKYYTFS